MREFEMYWLALLLTVVILAAIFVLLRSRHGLALTAIRDNELAAQSTGIGVWSIKFTVYVLTAFGTAMVGAFIFLQKLRISPDTAFSVNDWTAFVIFITVIGGIGRIEGPIIGTIIFFALRQTFRRPRQPLLAHDGRGCHRRDAVGAKRAVGNDR
jgi:branched-chain amino acid transport system permease protein